MLKVRRYNEAAKPVDRVAKFFAFLREETREEYLEEKISVCS